MSEFINKDSLIGLMIDQVKEIYWGICAIDIKDGFPGSIHMKVSSFLFELSYSN